MLAEQSYLPLIFLAVMGLAMLAYVILDGYDLGVGILLPWATTDQKDTMIASIGPFWDANETWLVLGVGVLLVAFPVAHGIVLTALYLPVTLMLFGLILRGVAFDFRVKAEDNHKPWWNAAFAAGSWLAALAQGYMLGAYITGFAETAAARLFAAGIALTLPAGYALLGSGWLLMKTDGELQAKAARWAKRALLPMVVAVVGISLATPLVSAEVYERWFSFPNIVALMPIPVVTALAFYAIRYVLARPQIWAGDHGWLVFANTVLIFLLAFFGLAYSLFPYVIVDRMTAWEAAADLSALRFIGVGVAITLPAIIGYTMFSYRVFWGKATALRYE